MLIVHNKYTVTNHKIKETSVHFKVTANCFIEKSVSQNYVCYFFRDKSL
jgi:hypothetical protein